MRFRVVHPSPGNGPTRFYVDDVEVDERTYRRAEARSKKRRKKLAAGDTVMTQRTTTWPMVSENLGVLPHQVAKANARAKRHGIKVYYRPDGDCVVSSKTAFLEMCKLEGFTHRQY